jgi:hypothetical protein
MKNLLIIGWLTLLCVISPLSAEERVRMVIKSDELNQTLESIQKRLVENDLEKPQVTQTTHYAILKFTSGQSLETLRSIAVGPQLEFREKLEEGSWKVWLDNAHFSRIRTSEELNRPGSTSVLHFETTEQGRSRLAEVSKKLLGKPLYIFLNGREVSAPVLQSPITGGEGQITGLKPEEAKLLEEQLNASVRFEILEMERVED